MRIRSVFLRSGAQLTGAARGGGSRGSWGAGGGCDPLRGPQLAVPGLRRAGMRAADSARGMNGKGVLPSRPHCPAMERAGSSGPLAAQVGSWGQTVVRSGSLAGCPEPWVLARPRRPGHRCAFRKGALCAAPEVAKPAHSPCGVRPRSPWGDRAGDEGTTLHARRLRWCSVSPDKVWGERKPQANFEGFDQCQREREALFPFLRTTPFPHSIKRTLGEVLAASLSSWLGGHNTCWLHLMCATCDHGHIPTNTHFI